MAQFIPVNVLVSEMMVDVLLKIFCRLHHFFWFLKMTINIFLSHSRGRGFERCHSFITAFRSGSGFFSSSGTVGTGWRMSAATSLTGFFGTFLDFCLFWCNSSSGIRLGCGIFGCGIFGCQQLFHFLEVFKVGFIGNWIFCFEWRHFLSKRFQILLVSCFHIFGARRTIIFSGF